MISKRTRWLAIVATLALTGAGCKMLTASPEQNQVMCTQDAKLCPDGSAVGRTGPKCEFAPCPETDQDIKDWKTMEDPASGLAYKYPESLHATYITTVDWPPKLLVVNQAYKCTEAGSEKRSIDNREYCVTKVVEGAAGSTYTQYTYAYAKDGKTAIFTFTLRTPQCMNYDGAQQAACQTEQAGFDIGATIDRIARTVQPK